MQIHSPTLTAPDDGMAEVVQLVRRGAFSAALAQLLPRLQAGDGRYAVLDSAASCYWNLGDHDTAMSLMQVMVRSWPQNADIWAKLGSMAMTLGEKAAARDFFERCLQSEPRSVNALVALNMLAPFAPRSHRAGLLRDLAARRDLPVRDRANALNALGLIDEAAGRTKPAFRNFARANAMVPGRYDPSETERHLDDQEKRFRPAPVLSGNWPRMIFVVGLPRSGTTLVEGIFARHHGVTTLGESPALPYVLRRLSEQWNRTGPFDWMEPDGPDPAGLRALYLTAAGVPSAGPDTVLVDKMPLNCLHMGLAQTLFPDARFVFLSRHPLDTGLSNFRTNFHEAHPFTRRLDWLGHLIRGVYASLDLYRPILGSALRVQSFRALVTAPQHQVPALIAHAGLNWDEACLSPERATRAVQTASVLQVRERINTKGLDRWKTYSRELQPLVDALGGPAWLAEWEARDSAAAGAEDPADAWVA